MYAKVGKSKDNKEKVIASSISSKQSTRASTIKFVDSRPATIAQRKQLLSRALSRTGVIQREIGEGGISLRGRKVINHFNGKRYEIVGNHEFAGVTEYKLRDDGGSEFFVRADHPSYDLVEGSSATAMDDLQVDSEAPQTMEVFVDETMAPRLQEQSSFAVKVETGRGQRIAVDSRGHSGLEQIREKRKEKRRHFIDLSYHEHVQAIDAEFQEFAKQYGDKLSPLELHVAYNMIMAQQMVNRVSSSDGRTQYQVRGPFPITGLTLPIMEQYHEVHYKKHLVQADKTASTRVYEAEYLPKLSRVAPFEFIRAFALPEATSEAEVSLVNAIGANLDSNTPTKSNTIGQGKVYSSIYKNFQRTMELINEIIDGQLISKGMFETDNPEGEFLFRTRLHNEMLDEFYLRGLYENESIRFKEGLYEGIFSDWSELKTVIYRIDELLRGYLINFDDMIKGPCQFISPLLQLQNNRKFVKEFELLGTILGLMIKKEKRKITNKALTGVREGEPVDSFAILVKLAEIEKRINAEIELFKHIINPKLSEEAKIREGIREGKKMMKELN